MVFHGKGYESHSIQASFWVSVSHLKITAHPAFSEDKQLCVKQFKPQSTQLCSEHIKTVQGAPMNKNNILFVWYTF